MVQAGKVSVEDKVKSCRLHNLFRDLANKKGKEENFLETLSSGRYIAVHDDSPFSGHLSPHVRTIISFGKVTFNFKGKKLLRVLDLDGSSIRELPKEIGEMSLLRYLGLRDTGITKLPSSLARLQHLQTLDILNEDQNAVEIPNVIWKLECLRHLIVWQLSSDKPLRIEGLKSLRTMVCIHYDVLICNSLITLTNLQKLAIRVEASSEMDKFFISLSKLGNLPPLEGLSKLNHLCELKLVGKMNVLPPLPPNLKRLVLFATELDEDPMPMLAKLEHLSFLKLEKTAYPRKEVVIPRNGFYRLNFLEFKRMIDLRTLKIDKDALPELRSLRIRSCRYLRRLPEELKSMPLLQTIELVSMPEELKSMLQTIELVSMPEELISRVLELYKDREIPSVWIFEQDQWKDEYWD